MRELFLVRMLSIPFLLSYSSIISAENKITPALKPAGISIEWSQHALDLDVNHLDTSLPGLPPGAIDAIKSQAAATSNIELINLRLDYQILPYLNLYGAVGKVTDTTHVDFFAPQLGLSDMTIESDGTAYTAGGQLFGRYNQWIPSLQYTHSRLNLDNNSGDATINALIPSIGMQTDYGIFSASLIYHDVEATYSGAITVPGLGNVPVTATTENSTKTQFAVGWHTRIAKDLYLQTTVGLSGQEQLQVQLNKRF